ncbi:MULTISPECIES: hypothetical protein [Nocardiopsis]|uniref:Uncharacterized protein n=2 Tax=Nocardiopsis TaxID=2013 RepID=A0A840WDE8_9ACTN|nr:MULTISPECIES: hypothetical protein [Nocardiopsis]MBB5493433.1 hypothetical protein [Nocardiopsis metallicus]MEE2051645.1 hypothetical protein [Nocardiopsis umidischolae]
MALLSFEIFATPPEHASLDVAADLFTLRLAHAEPSDALQVLDFDVVAADPLLVIVTCLTADAARATDTVASWLVVALAPEFASGWQMHAGHTTVHHTDN